MGVIVNPSAAVGNYSTYSLIFNEIDLSVDVTKEVGPRIIRITGPKVPENPLYVDAGDPLKARGHWILRGGHRVWPYRDPWADETEECYAADNLPYQPVVTEDSVEFISVADPNLHRGFRISVSSSGALMVTAILKNVSDMMWSGGAWSLTCIDPKEKSFAVPLGAKDGNWDVVSVHRVLNWGGHSSRLVDPQFSEQPFGPLQIIKPNGDEAKRTYGAYRGWMGCLAAQYSFFKVFPYDPTRPGDYPLGDNAATYLGPDAFMVEMESMGYKRPLKPGERLEHKEIWVFSDPIPWTKADLIEEMLAPHIEVVNQ